MDKPIEYEQYDTRWKNIMYSSIGSKSQTIGVSGCGPSSAAMVVATLRDKNVTPKEAAAWARVNGYRTANDGTAWTFFPAYLKKYNIPCEQTPSAEKALSALRKNYMVITTAGKGIWTTGGHVFLAYGLSADGGKVYINDPNSEAQYKELANVYNYKSESRQFWIVKEDWKVEKIEVEIVHSEHGKLKITAVNVDGENFIRLRDTEKIAPITVGWNGKNPTVTVNYN